MQTALLSCERHLGRLGNLVQGRPPGKGLHGHMRSWTTTGPPLGSHGMFLSRRGAGPTLARNRTHNRKPVFPHYTGDLGGKDTRDTGASPEGLFSSP